MVNLNFYVFVQGPVYLDTMETFYGPKPRRSWLGLLRFSMFKHGYDVSQKGIEGNLKGDGTLLGGVFVVSPNEVLYEHREKFFGDHANITDVLAAAEKISNVKK